MSNSEPHYEHGQRTPAGREADNARARAKRTPTRRSPGSPKPFVPKPGEAVSLEEFLFAVPVVNPYHTKQDVEDWISYSVAMCGAWPTFTRSDIEGIKACRLVPTHKLRAAYAERAEDPEFYNLFLDELTEARGLRGEFGPEATEHYRLAEYLRSKLGIDRIGTKDCLRVGLLIDYRLASVLTKTLGLRPYEIGV